MEKSCHKSTTDSGGDNGNERAATRPASMIDSDGCNIRTTDGGGDNGKARVANKPPLLIPQQQLS
jgi:hypothetical protein